MQKRKVLLLMAILLGMAVCSNRDVHAQDSESAIDLKAPDGWGGERISLPPQFAPNMQVKGIEEIRFAPGMFKPESKSFFSYVFVFQLEQKPELSRDTIQRELLTYYRGLATAVLKRTDVEVDPKSFTLKLNETKIAGGPTNATGLSGDLKWLEPFQTRKPQTLHIEAHSWHRADKNYLFVCVSPKDKKAAIWADMYKIRSAYFQSLKD